MPELRLGPAPVFAVKARAEGDRVERDGETWYRIRDYHAMPPFFMTVVSGSDHWMFVSSTGGLTCGRRDPDNALFPYTTDDKVHDAAGTTGPVTCLRVADGDHELLWEPFARGPAVYRLQRNLYKNRAGNRLMFEEINRDLELAYSYCWNTGCRYGFIRRSELRNIGGQGRRVEILDGLRNLLPYGVQRNLQTTRSTLVDAYKQAEQVGELPLALFTLSSIPSDRAEPSEALGATVVWSVGLEEPGLLLSVDQLEGFCSGAGLQPETRQRGKRGAFLVNTTLDLPAGDEKSWYIVADLEQGPGEVRRLARALEQGLDSTELDQDIDTCNRRLRSLVAGADGYQHSADALTTGRHFSNTLFNIMRGGVFVHGYRLPRDDFLDFVQTWDGPLHERVERLTAESGDFLSLDSALQIAREAGDADFERLVREYLPLTFSRRHGDPSRPWNEFSIRVRNPDDSLRLDYQGNWRDIFQNWEALAWSYPEFIESFITRFLNATTADGYNPYRIMREGFDWEVLDPDDPWSNIGYWGDHQVGYLHRLLDFSRRAHPGRLERSLDREIFVFADLPYRLRPYREQVADPRHTVDYDAAHADRIAARVAGKGSDGKLLHDRGGRLVRATLAEKLLVPALAKIAHLVPEGGIWMHTQRPEWNDANNSLVGYGLSMVTLCYLRRYLVLVRELFAGSDLDGFRLAVELEAFRAALHGVFSEHHPRLEGAFTDAGRKAFLDAAGALAEAYRASVYAGAFGGRTRVGRDELLSFLTLVIDFLDHSIARNRRDDGLYHAYNLVRFEADAYTIERLDEMLEGQVAVLSSGFLGPAEALDLLRSLRASRLYTPERNSYLLYPDRQLPRFLEKNVIAADALPAGNGAGLRPELHAYLEGDDEGAFHFRAQFRNARVLREALAGDPRVGGPLGEALCELHERVFRHHRFTGRSGSMYKYEGLGCIYWHMVSKLGLAVAELHRSAMRRGADPVVIRELADRFRDIQEGLGVHISPADYGAFPTDPYSHSPGFAGVQQPGLTGQVKEDIIARFLELGVVIEGGELVFAPRLLRRSEFLAAGARWSPGLRPDEDAIDLPAGSLGFQLCGVAIVYRLAQEASITVVRADGHEDRRAGHRLDQDQSAMLFRRSGEIRRIEVGIVPAQLAEGAAQNR